MYKSDVELYYSYFEHLHTGNIGLVEAVLCQSENRAIMLTSYTRKVLLLVIQGIINLG